MAKKKRPSAAVSAPSAAVSAPSADLKTLIRDSSIFFDRLVELVPARFYLPSDDVDKPWFQGLSKAAKASAKKATRENIKKARRARLDPANSDITTLDLLRSSIHSQKDQSSQEFEPRDAESCAKIPDDRSVTYEELRQRLRRKIEELKGNRNTRPQERPQFDEAKKKGTILGGKRDKSHVEDGGVVEKDAKKAKADDSEVGLEFGHVKIGEGRSGKRKGLSKKKELEKAEKLREEAKKNPEVSKKLKWKAAVSRAAGEKVHDDPGMIRESMRKERKRQEKSVEKWKERVETTRRMKDERQKKRSENIKGKIEKKKAKRIEKREKKLMRPGFEGRKAGYINET